MLLIVLFDCSLISFVDFEDVLEMLSLEESENMTGTKVEKKHRQIRKEGRKFIARVSSSKLLKK